MDHQQKIRELLKDGQIIPVVGAGVSFATAGMPSWKGLIDDGIQYAKRLKKDATIIEEAQNLSNAYKLTQAATLVKQLLNAHGHPYVNWLNSVFEKPVIKSTKLIESIQNLCLPIIATTNYDDLLQSVGNVQISTALDWSQSEEIQSHILKRKPFIFHLHGIYNRPRTPIFGDNDYERLKSEEGYKTILNNLWMNKSFLFIGCSRDGVMDEDFLTVLRLMKEWFPGVQKEHYILMQDQMIGTTQHYELMQECNVHIVPFGANHNDLPHFINSLNPNIEEIVKRFDDRKAHVRDAIVSILEDQPNIDLPKNVKKFIQSTLGIEHYWLDSDRLQIFTQALHDYNNNQLSKQKQLANRQVLIRTIITLNELEEKVELWKKSSDGISLVNNIDFINTAILSYRLLESFPREMLKDIHHRQYYTIHNQYITGNLEQFYNEAVQWKEGSRNPKDLENSYFFENLKRIIQSLLDVLTLNSEEIYNKKREATIIQKLPDQNLIIVHPKLLTIRSTASPYIVQASLPWDKNLEFIDAFIVHNSDERIIVGYNSKHCFKWNPQEDLIVTNFFDAKEDDEIINLSLIDQGPNLVLQIFTKTSRNILINFSELVSFNLSNSLFKNYVSLPLSGKLYCRKSVSMGVIGNCIFEVNALDEYKPMITVEEIWEMLATIPEVSSEYQNYLAKIKKEGDKDYFYPYIQDLNIHPAKWLKKEILIVKIRFNFRESISSTALIFIDTKLGFKQPLLTMLFKHKICFSYDIICTDNKVNLMVGYLDSGDVGNLIQYFENINNSDLILARNQPGIFPQDKLTSFKLRDMYGVIIATSKRAFVNEEGRTIHDVNLPGLEAQTLELEDRIVAIHYTDAKNLNL
ncbi:MAG: SIR2 family protein [Chitinophagaceae bacterium]